MCTRANLRREMEDRKQRFNEKTEVRSKIADAVKRAIGNMSFKTHLLELAEEIIQVLTSDPTGTVKVTVEIEAEFPNGAADYVKRAVSENAGQLGLRNADWE